MDHSDFTNAPQARKVTRRGFLALAPVAAAAALVCGYASNQSLPPGLEVEETERPTEALLFDRTTGKGWILVCKHTPNKEQVIRDLTAKFKLRTGGQPGRMDAIGQGRWEVAGE